MLFACEHPNTSAFKGPHGLTSGRLVFIMSEILSFFFSN